MFHEITTVVPSVHKCMLVSMGYRGDPLGQYHFGGVCLEEYVVDIRHLKNDCRGGPWGFDPRMQERVRAMAGFD